MVDGRHFVISIRGKIVTRGQPNPGVIRKSAIVNRRFPIFNVRITIVFREITGRQFA